MKDVDLDPLERKIVNCLELDDFGLSVYEIAMDIYHNDESPPDDEEERSVRKCLMRLEGRGLVTSWQTNFADFGVDTVWRSLLTPGRRVLDPGR
jgi:hypothetical protein